jgi:MFS family permease
MGFGIFGGGGGGLSAGTPREILNWRLWYAVLLFGLLGAARGFDEGNVSGMVSQLSFISQFGLHDPSLSKGQQADLLSNITAMVQIGCVGGALLAFLLTDRIGRVRSLQALCLVWILGVVIQITSRGNVGQLYAGRFIAGLGIGQTTGNVIRGTVYLFIYLFIFCGGERVADGSLVVGPTYLVEVAPREIRGLCTCVFSGSVYLGIMLGYFANWGTSLHIANDDRNQWVIPTSVQIIFAGYCSSVVVLVPG